MTEFLTKLFVKDSDKTDDPKVRSAYGSMCGTVGIISNVLLFAAKLIAGILSGAVSITADAFNNLSDAGSSVVTLIGFKMSGKPADDEHPFGHGRYEYLTGLGISVVIIMVGVELFKSSLNGVIHPTETKIGTISIIILIASILMKIWMSVFNRKIAKKIDSSAMAAAAIDSITDSIATGIVLLGIVISGIIPNLNLDGWLGMFVAVFIVYAGIRTALDNISPLLGNPPSAEFVKDVENTVLECKEIIGVHDLIVHDYGAGRRIISIHAEVPADSDILRVHDAIDNVERELKEKYNCIATIHMDPVIVNDPEINELREKTEKIVSGIDETFSLHDFRVVKGDTHTNMIFDVAIPHKCSMTEKEIEKRIVSGVDEIEYKTKLFAVIHVERLFVGNE